MVVAVNPSHNYQYGLKFLMAKPITFLCKYGFAMRAPHASQIRQIILESIGFRKPTRWATSYILPIAHHLQLIMSRETLSHAPHGRYLSLQEIEDKQDLFDTLLQENCMNADAESSAKIELGEEQSMTPEAKQEHHGCKCSKIGCLKLYCECFANGRKCGGNCECTDCHNHAKNTTGIYQAQMVANLRHPGYFKGVPALTPARRCTCKKSMCQKRYCECYSAGLKCTEFCECKECQNGHPHSHSPEEEYFEHLSHKIEVEVQA